MKYQLASLQWECFFFRSVFGIEISVATIQYDFRKLVNKFCDETCMLPFPIMHAIESDLNIFIIIEGRSILFTNTNLN